MCFLSSTVVWVVGLRQGLHYYGLLKLHSSWGSLLKRLIVSWIAWLTYATLGELMMEHRKYVVVVEECRKRCRTVLPRVGGLMFLRTCFEKARRHCAEGCPTEKSKEGVGDLQIPVCAK